MLFGRILEKVLHRVSAAYYKSIKSAGLRRVYSRDKVLLFFVLNNQLQLWRFRRMQNI